MKNMLLRLIISCICFEFSTFFFVHISTMHCFNLRIYAHFICKSIHQKPYFHAHNIYQHGIFIKYTNICITYFIFKLIYTSYSVLCAILWYRGYRKLVMKSTRWRPDGALTLRKTKLGISWMPIWALFPLDKNKYETYKWILYSFITIYNTINYVHITLQTSHV